MDYYLHDRRDASIATLFIVLSSVFLLLAVVAYVRVYVVIQLDPGVVPLGPRAIKQEEELRERKKNKKTAQSFSCGPDLEANRYEAWPDDTDADSPGLEAFYSKDVFVCNTDGRPRWCTSCCNWKPDRAHHCSELDRCVNKMDHYCPWVGGIVAGTCQFNLCPQHPLPPR